MTEEKKAEPFVKWVGGKRGLVDRIIEMMPASFGHYYEPFVGGGALFFSLTDKIKEATISDRNIELMIAYKVIQKHPKQLIELLKDHKAKHSETYYYEVRAKNPEDPIEAAARFIYLNKTCYNGLYRVNNSGTFNVPIGKYDDPLIVQEDNIMACHKALKNTTIVCEDFEKIDPKAKDFVYFDPPYHPTTEASFTKYTKEDFAETEQTRLRDFINILTKNGVSVMLSNSKTDFINELYSSKGYFKTVVDASRMVNCKPNKRNRVEELLITNYPIVAKQMVLNEARNTSQL
jgi:DNA adenine methylase